MVPLGLALLVLLSGFPGPTIGAGVGQAPVPPVAGEPSARACPDTVCPHSGHGPGLVASGRFGWFNVTHGITAGPPARTGARIVFDPVDNYLVLFGGCDAQACPAPAATWVYSGGAWTNLTGLGPQPPARTGASFAFDDAGGAAVLYGGYGASGRMLNDTWSFVGGKWTNHTNKVFPAARRDAGLVYDPTDGYLVLFGGCGRSCPLSDTWKFVAGNWTNITGAVGLAPPARWGAGFTFDGADGYVLLVDGCGPVSCPLNDTWSFAKNRWSSISPPNSPPKRFGAALTYQAAPNATYLFGGNSSARTFSDTWEFLGGRWTNVTASVGAPPSSRVGAALLPTSDGWWGTDTPLPFAILFGGAPNGCLPCRAGSFGDTWVLEAMPVATATALPVVAEQGQSVNFTTSVADGSPPFACRWQFGDGGTASSPSASHSYAQTGLYGPIVTVTDWAGVSTRSAILVSVVVGPTASASVTPNPLDTGQTVTFAGSARGGSPPYSYLWSFGDGTNSSAANAVHSYGRPGSYPVAMTVTDSVQGFGVWHGTVVVDPALAASASASQSSAMVGSDVTFSATPLGGTAPYVVNWTFGDGTSGTGTVVGHVYNRSGSYPVQATVVDATGARFSQGLTVQVSSSTTGPSGAPLGWYVAGAAGSVIVVAVLLAWFLVVGPRRRRRRARQTSLAGAASQGYREDEEPGTLERSRRPNGRRRR